MKTKFLLIFLQGLLLSVGGYSVCKQFPVEELPLYVPSLEEVAKAFNENLGIYFENVEVSVVECPDLTQKPFSLAAEGLSGSPTIFEAGSESYLLPCPDKTKVYDLKDIHQQTGVNPALVLGAGAGPFPYLHSASEYIANAFIKDKQVVKMLSQIATVKDDKLYTETLPDDVSNYALMANFFVSEGKPGNVVKVKVSKRIAESEFSVAMKESITKAFPDKSIGIGGTFLITNSKVYQHVQPQFSKVPLLNETMRDDWLAFYNMSSPLTAVGTFLTSDPGLTLRLYHFHSLSDHKEAGHYHYDQDPETVEYLAYLNVGTKIVRLDRPSQQNSGFPTTSYVSEQCENII